MTAITRPRVSSSQDSGERPAALPARRTFSSCGTFTSTLPARMPYPRPCSSGRSQGRHEIHLQSRVGVVWALRALLIRVLVTSTGGNLPSSTVFTAARRRSMSAIARHKRVKEQIEADWRQQTSSEQEMTLQLVARAIA